ncbi:glutarate dioxygenase GlaH [Paraburkholderia tropica]|uniref:glutarate dioxygenase GlaH n=1 Tax=Paraburkholderia tropica TaxID=92647 RepID=UPI001590A9FE|nr:glutarate dioxygenase GlaH [Paraburkholderia tropica]
MDQQVRAQRPTELKRHKNYVIETHPEHERIVHFRIEKTALEKYLELTSHIDVQNLEYVPYMRFHIADQLIKCVGGEFTKDIVETLRDRRSGGFTVGLQQLTANEDDFVRFGTAIGHLIGPSNHDSMSGKYYARFLVKHTDSSDSYLRQAYRLFTMHTDGTFVSEATDWLLMMKFSELNAVGGESRFLHLDDWDELQRFLQHPMATRPFLYKAPGSKNVDERVERPVFFQSEFGLSMSFIDQFVQPKDRQEARYLFDLSNSMESSSGTKEVGLPVGDVVVLNNYFYVHGRAPFVQNENLHRELMRLRGSFALNAEKID